MAAPHPHPPPLGNQQPFPNGAFQNSQGQQPMGGQFQNFQPPNGGPPISQFANMQINPNAQANRAGAFANMFAQNSAVPTRYEGVTLRKNPDPPYGEEPSWAWVVESPMPFSNEELIKTVNKRKDQVQKDLKKLRSDNQRIQIERLVELRTNNERHPNAEWVIVSVDEERGQKKVNETETKAIHVIMKRQQKIKTKSKKDSTGRKNSNSAGTTQNLNYPPRNQNGIGMLQQQQQQQHRQPPLGGGLFGAQIPNGMGPQQGHGPPHFQQQNGHGPGLNMPMGPQNQPHQQQQQQFGPMNMNQRPGPPPMANNFPPPPQMHTENQPQRNFPPPPPPINIPQRGVQGNFQNQPARPQSRDTDDDIVDVIDLGSPPKSKHRNNSHGGRNSQPIVHNHRHSGVSFTSSDDENLSPFSRRSGDFTNVTTPTTGSLPRSLDRSKSRRHERHGSADYFGDVGDRMARDRRSLHSRARHGSRASDDLLLDGFVDIRNHGSRGREGRGYSASSGSMPRPYYGDRTASDSLYKPIRRLTAAEHLDKEFMLEQIRRDEDARLDDVLRERDRYERERERELARELELERDSRARARYRSPARYDQQYERSPTRRLDSWRR